VSRQLVQTSLQAVLSLSTMTL